MALSGEAKKKYNEEYRRKLKEVDQLLDSLKQKDALEGGKRYKSEVLSYENLGKIYYGQAYKDIGEEDDPRKKKIVVPNPSNSEILGSEKTFYEWLELRDEARKNLFWLGQTILRKDFIQTTHQVVCDQFVQKNFDDVYHAGYKIGEVHAAFNKQERLDDKGNATKEMLLLDPRGFFKSSIDGVDCIQWMLNVPDIRILILTGEYKLAVAFMKEIKGYLYMAKGEDPTDLHLLFPEYVLRGVDGTSKEPFTLECRNHNQKEPTLWVNSIDSNLSGWHCDVKKGDDVITDENCNTSDAREELKKKFDGTGNLLDEWGFSDNIGTRYYTDDWYGSRLKEAAEDSDAAVKYFCRQCWVVKPEYAEVPLRELTEDMVILNFPEKATFKSLRSKLLKDEPAFRCQQLNEPKGSDADSLFKVSFDEDTLRRHLYQKEAAPQVGDIYICWDWALTADKRSDYSAGVVGRIYKKPDGLYGLVILEVLCDKWTSGELALQIISLNKKWHPKKTLIENSNGAEFLKNELHRLSIVFGTTLDIFWKPVSLQANAKRNRIKGLEVLLKDDRLWFVMGSWVDQTFEQLQRYTGEPKNRGRKDDIPDAMSYFHIAFFPIDSMNQKDAEEAKIYMEQEKAKSKIKAHYNRIFGSPSLSSPEPEIDIPQEEDPRRAAMNRLFGGNGMRA